MTVFRDRRHIGESEDTFTPHLKIIKDQSSTDNTPWLLYFHARIAAWVLMGRYRSQKEAMAETDYVWLRWMRSRV